MALDDVIKKQMENQAKSVIDNAFANLSPESNKNKLPIDIFDKYFAPFFFGNQQLNEQSDIFSTWVGIAGSPMASVDVVDTADNILFTVPPLYNTGMIGFLKNNEFSQVMNEYQLYNNSLPSVAMGFVEGKLLPAAENNIKENIRETYIEPWKEVAARYTNSSVDKAIVANTGIINHSDDDLSYDV